MNLNKMKINCTCLSDQLKHLSENELRKVLLDYYINNLEEEDIKEIFEITSLVPLLEVFPAISFNSCSICNKEKWMKLPVRDVFGENFYSLMVKNVICEHCLHDEDYLNCICDNAICIDRRETEKEQERVRLETIKKNKEKELIEKVLRHQEAKEKRERLVTIHRSLTNKIAEKELGLIEKLFLGLVVKVCYVEETKELNFNNISQRPTATFLFFWSIVKHLLAERIILPSSTMPIEYFIIAEGDRVEYDIAKMKYKINVSPFDDNNYYFIQRLIYPKADEFLGDKEFCYMIWKNVAIDEVVALLYRRLEEMGSNYEIQKKHYRVFDHLLDYFSIRQIYNFVFKVTARVKTKNNDAINLSEKVVYDIEKMGERAIVDGWKVKSYTISNTESIFTKMVFNNILGIGELAYEVIPTSQL
ncbi:hypothetical protein SporoP37_13735 [Sporosarcina sp. P37]|uniref:hypothetical protein n=1 Tax=unclassified Sporosarcina TaxID=2647733 RepID=UPI000A17F741|nr:MULTISPECIES: hypothetical protein [unclassified Sporosarcina]ARK25608.1 hypothetical protein SporoP37_13735 [Sporosarcina sp. P37]PID18008.1 hypothetical protein CSV62_10340 [Sporosarcina sp. P35]